MDRDTQTILMTEISAPGNGMPTPVVVQANTSSVTITIKANGDVLNLFYYQGTLTLCSYPNGENEDAAPIVLYSADVEPSPNTGA